MRSQRRHPFARLVCRVRVLGLLVAMMFLLGAAPSSSAASESGGCRVAVFSGHTESLTCLGGNRGAKSATGTDEFRFNDEVTKLFQARTAPGTEFIMLPASLNIPLESRAALAERLGACLLVEIHHDNVQPEIFEQLVKAREDSPSLVYYRGFSLHVYGDEKSIELAAAIESAMIGAGLPHSTFHREDIPGEAMKLIAGSQATYERKNLVLLKTARVPAVIIECGCIANPREERILQDPVYRRRLAAAIQRGIVSYLDRRTPPCFR